MPVPTFRVEIVKRLGLEEWSNTWELLSANLADAVAAADVLVTFERHMHGNIVTFEYYRVSRNVVGDRIFRHVALNVPGLIDFAGSPYLPLFNTYRVDFTTNDSDGCRKYFRGPVQEQNQTNGQVDAGVLATFNGFITTYFMNTIAPDNVVTGKGDAVTGGSVYPFVQMRQLHRKRKKKAPPA